MAKDFTDLGFLTIDIDTGAYLLEPLIVFFSLKIIIRYQRTVFF